MHDVGEAMYGSGGSPKVGRLIGHGVLAGTAIFVMFAAADFAVSAVAPGEFNKLWPMQLIGSLVIGFMAPVFGAWEKSAARQSHADAMMWEVAELERVLEKLPLPEFEGFVNLSRDLSRDGIVMMEDRPATRAVWKDLVQKRWAVSQTNRLAVGNGLLAYTLTEKGFRGMPLLVARVMRQWNELANQFDRLTGPTASQ